MPIPCTNCGNDLSVEGSFTYFSGDKHDAHLEIIDGKRVIVSDGFAETDSITTCNNCGADVQYDDQDVF